MSDRPILFSAPMVRALLDGRKTQTRRLLKPKKDTMSCLLSNGWTDDYILDPGNREWLESYYRWRVGDRLYVRETWRCNGWASDVATIFYQASEQGGYTAMTEQFPVAGKKPLRVEAKWHPSIHMPRWASRLTLTVTDVRVQRLQDISTADAIAEGCKSFGPRPGDPIDQDTKIGGPEDAYRHLWNEINGAGAWNTNPWVVAVTFRVARHNIDQPILIEKMADVAEGARRGSPPSGA